LKGYAGKKEKGEKGKLLRGFRGTPAIKRGTVSKDGSKKKKTNRFGWG